MPCRPHFVVLCALCIGCGPDETVSGYADPAATYRLISINEAPFAAAATITFPEEGTVVGAGPCNSFRATQSAPYPWFELGPVIATKRACPDLAAEQQFFNALSRMTLAEVQEPVLILSNTEGETLVFQSD